ncbi:hypothetical protein K450DRAFT_236104 [Umbelopsis ramanniana AG]|uniref:Uncharacterized protein n=1 Tax=Umbelopsis ramanniana AG TaxID=1314678 RepID=A0AAD5HF73_UMBRA|nr:uncharacterized protein K450DRAFT_236104 [Umbelopsis ramanniana AG]KAI8580814.1 hypothetical protein K450DRAFT_236104 [Umbelopsis ramanniana AG]
MSRSPNDPNTAVAVQQAAAQQAAAEAAAAAAANAGYNYPYYPYVPSYPQPRLAARYTRASGSHLQQMYSPYSMQYQQPSSSTTAGGSSEGHDNSNTGGNSYSMYVDNSSTTASSSGGGPSLGYIYPPGSASTGSPHQQPHSIYHQPGTPYYDSKSSVSTTPSSSSHLLPTPTGSNPAWQQDTYHHHHNDSTTSPHPSAWDRRKPSPASPTASHFASVFGKMSVKRSSESSGSGSPMDRSPRPSVRKMSDDDNDSKPSGGNQFDWVL